MTKYDTETLRQANSNVNGIETVRTETNGNKPEQRPLLYTGGEGVTQQGRNTCHDDYVGQSNQALEV